MKVSRLPVIHTTEPRDYPLELHIAHLTPGRTRFHLSLIRKNDTFCRAIEGRLRREASIHRVEARAHTGSLVIEHAWNEALDLGSLRFWIQEALRNPDAYMVLEDELTDAPSLVIENEEHLNWCSLSTQGIVKELQTSETLGLASSDIEARRLRYGANDVEQVRPTSRWVLFRRQFGNSQTLLLAGSAGLSLLTGGIFDVVMIGGVILLNGYIGYISEAHADEVICSIGSIEPQEVRVLRDGKQCNILDRELVVGDVLVLAHGVVPADLRLIDSTENMTKVN